MEENNRKGPGVFYAVVGVATLVVAIIGATFAYFSASVESADDAINGRTLNISSADLDVSVTPVEFTGHTVTTNLAPALVGEGIADPSALTAANVQAMVNARCEEANKYTGCHVWQITATNRNTQDDITHANIWLNLSVTATDKDQWGYAVFTTTGNVAAAGTTALNDVAFATVGGGRLNRGALATDITGTTLDIHNNAVLAKNSSVTYYLMVYLNDDKAVQNAAEPVTGTSTDARGSYVGNVTFDAMGGKVRASFASA